MSQNRNVRQRETTPAQRAKMLDLAEKHGLTSETIGQRFSMSANAARDAIRLARQERESARAAFSTTTFEK